MEQVDSVELHLGRIHDVKDLRVLGGEVRDVKEEVILESSGHQLDSKVCMLSSSNENSVGSAGVLSVPVSLPIGSMITGTAFNVITPDQLPHFKQMLCVDKNGYISGSSVVGNMSGNLKTIAIQQQSGSTGGSVCGVTNPDGSGSNNSHDSAITGDNMAREGGTGCCSGSTVSWSDTGNHVEVFPIRCKTTSAELFRSKLGSGGRGRCVKYKDQWFTPSEFENLCGRGSSKDWKRSIKYGGKSLQSLIDEGKLVPHATNCSCVVCCDDESASGPVRLFSPYKRRKRNQRDLDTETAPKRKRNNNFSNNDSEAPPPTTVVEENNIFLGDDNITSKDEPWPTLNDSLDTSTELVDQTQNTAPYNRETYVVNINDPGSIAMMENNQTMKNLENVYSSMIKAANDLKRLIVELKSSFDRKVEILQKERDAAVAAMSTRVHTDIDDPNISGSFHGNEAKKCANCNREALAECSLCRKTPYCSEFCQRKDWNAHQVECTRNPAQTAAQQIMLLVDEQP